ncbi:Iron complex transport system ATP-binding protein OS=Castellaniella defragrans OX=75697 GN=HNR28_001983 PE=4 SV=1 [Castellaniella defragrans]
MLEASNILVRRRRRTILRHVRLALCPGRVCSLLGANGAGKSTLLSVLAAELKPDRTETEAPGQVTLNGRPLASFSAASLARARMVLPQKPGLAFDLSVAEVVAMGAYPFPELRDAQVAALTGRALGMADIPDLAGRRYLELSGGEQQRAQFARVVLQALAARDADPEARYLLLDEPTASLDPLHQQTMLKTLARLAREERMGVLVILHDVNLAARWSDAIALLSDAEIVACGSPSEVLTVENIRRVYGVDSRVMPHPDDPDRPLVVFR